MGLSQGFLEKAALLLLTGGLSGFYIPYVLKQIDERKLIDQKRFDARKLQEQKEFDTNLVRANNVLEAQIKLLENLSESLWELQLLSLAVSYYKVHPNQERYEVALKDYDEKSWGLFKDIRSEVSQAIRLISAENHSKLLIFFSANLIQEMDEKLMSLIGSNASLEEWKEHYSFILKDFPLKIDDVVKLLAQELRLSSLNNVV